MEENVIKVGDRIKILVSQLQGAEVSPGDILIVSNIRKDGISAYSDVPGKYARIDWGFTLDQLGTGFVLENAGNSTPQPSFKTIALGDKIRLLKDCPGIPARTGDTGEVTQIDARGCTFTVKMGCNYWCFIMSELGDTLEVVNMPYSVPTTGVKQIVSASSTDRHKCRCPWITVYQKGCQCAGV